MFVRKSKLAAKKIFQVTYFYRPIGQQNKEQITRLKHVKKKNLKGQPEERLEISYDMNFNYLLVF